MTSRLPTRVKCGLCMQFVDVPADDQLRYDRMKRHQKECTGRTPEKMQQAEEQRQMLITEFAEQQERARHEEDERGAFDPQKRPRKRGLLSFLKGKR